jgi:hypothetical protein
LIAASSGIGFVFGTNSPFPFLARGDGAAWLKSKKLSGIVVNAHLLRSIVELHRPFEAVLVSRIGAVIILVYWKLEHYLGNARNQVPREARRGSFIPRFLSRFSLKITVLNANTIGVARRLRG